MKTTIVPDTSEVESTVQSTKQAKKFKSRRSRHRWMKGRVSLRQSFVAVGVMAILVFVVWWVWLRSPQPIDTGRYQVVYLTNGQAYFGKLQNTSGEYLVMKQPYTAQAIEADTSKPEQPATTALLRVRDQVYGPDDSIAIRAETVAFWQNLRDDSKISAALKAKQQ